MLETPRLILRPWTEDDAAAMHVVFGDVEAMRFWTRRRRNGRRIWCRASGPSDVKAQFWATVDFVGDSRLVFDIAGNKYRLIVHVAYAHKRVLIKFVDTDAEYDKIDSKAV